MDHVQYSRLLPVNRQNCEHFFKTENMGCSVSLYIFEFQVANKTLPTPILYWNDVLKLQKQKIVGV